MAVSWDAAVAFGYLTQKELSVVFRLQVSVCEVAWPKLIFGGWHGWNL